MNIDELTIGQLKQIQAISGTGPDNGPWKVGEKYLIRTATHYITGRIVSIHAQELLLEDAAWIPDTGRYANALSSGNLDEVEPIYKGTEVVGRGAIVDACLWCHELPKDQK